MTGQGVSVTCQGRDLLADMRLTATGLATGQTLETAVVTSLLTAPGWWANTYETDDWGCRLLELRRAHRITRTLRQAEDYARQALAWLIKDGVVASIAVAAEWQGTRLALSVVVTQPGQATTQFSFVWDELTARL